MITPWQEEGNGYVLLVLLCVYHLVLSAQLTGPVRCTISLKLIRQSHVHSEFEWMASAGVEVYYATMWVSPIPRTLNPSPKHHSITYLASRLVAEPHECIYHSIGVCRCI